MKGHLGVRNWGARMLWAVVAVACVTPVALGDDDGFIELFNGKDLSQWKVKGGEGGYWTVGTATPDPNNPREFQVAAEGDQLINAQRSGKDIYSEREFGDAIVELEVMVPQGSNSGIYLMGEYEVQVLDSYGREKLTQGDMGAIYSAAPPLVNAAKSPGQWQRYHIRYRAPRFDADGKKVANALVEKILLNDVLIQENVEIKGPTGGSLRNREAAQGPLLFQGDHGPVAFRNIRVKPLEE